MPFEIIDGSKMAAEIRKEIKAEVEDMKARTGKVPGLTTILVGTRPESQTYVRNKKRACKDVGIASFSYDLPEDISQKKLLKIIKESNRNPDVHGILVQLPLPAHIDEAAVQSAISVEKDVDGIHPMNIGNLVMRGRKPLFIPCTPKACLEILDRLKVKIEGRRAVVVGRSNIVGIPVAMLLLHRNATLTLCHSYTQYLPAKTIDGDILIAAAGKPGLIRGDWIKHGAVVIDVGINSVEDPTSEKGYRLVGDVVFEEAQYRASAMTPVPVGVGPMTIAMLLRNTMDSANRFLSGKK